jgi:hypothetical protein
MRVIHRLHVFLQKHLIICFLLLTVSFVGFGVMSFDLIRVVAANADYLSSYGLMALKDGGLQQIFELWLKASMAMVFWILFKLCEGNLVLAFSRPRQL